MEISQLFPCLKYFRDTNFSWQEEEVPVFANQTLPTPSTSLLSAVLAFLGFLECMASSCIGSLHVLVPSVWKTVVLPLSLQSDFPCYHHCHSWIDAAFIYLAPVSLLDSQVHMGRACLGFYTSFYPWHLAQVWPIVGPS